MYRLDNIIWKTDKFHSNNCYFRILVMNSFTNFFPLENECLSILTLIERVSTLTEDWPGNNKHKFKLSFHSFISFLYDSGRFNEGDYVTAHSVAGDASSPFNLITVTVKSRLSQPTIQVNPQRLLLNYAMRTQPGFNIKLPK